MNHLKGVSKGRWSIKRNSMMRRAHAVSRVCKFAMVDSSENPGTYLVGILTYLEKNEMGYMWTLTEMELSLMYDILYTKAPVLHTLAGYCIRDSVLSRRSLWLLPFCCSCSMAGRETEAQMSRSLMFCWVVPSSWR
jgi:hypothetical protein